MAGKSGLKLHEKMKAGGLDAKAVNNVVMVGVRDIYVPPAGSPIAHPRFSDPHDEEMIASICLDGVREEIVVRDDGVYEDKRRLTLVDGARRLCNGLEAERRMLASGQLPEGASLYVKVRYFKGGDAELLLARLSCNSDPLKKADSWEVLSTTFVQLSNLGIDVADIAKVAPKGVGKAEVEALLNWGNLLPELQVAFNSGAPIGLLAEVLNAPREGQMECLDRLIGAGMTSQTGVTRLKNREKKEKSAAGGTPPGDKVRVQTLKKMVDAVRPHLCEHDAHEKAIEAITSGEVESPDAVRETIENLGAADLTEGFLKGLQYAAGEIGILATLPDAVRAAIEAALTKKPAARKSEGKSEGAAGDAPPVAEAGAEKPKRKYTRKAPVTAEAVTLDQLG